MPYVTTNISTQLEPPPEREPTPADVCEDCTHQGACTRQWELAHGCEFNTEQLAWLDVLADELGCESCDCWED